MSLIANVFGADNVWYGPDYPDAGEPPVEAKITNPTAFEDGKVPGQPDADHDSDDTKTGGARRRSAGSN